MTIRTTPNHRPFLLTIGLATTFALALSGCSGQPSIAPVGSSPSPSATLTALAQDAVDAGSPGVIVRVDTGTGSPIEFARQAEWTRADRILNPMDAFRVGSNTKTLVATLVLQLVASGEIALDEPIADYLPGAVPHGVNITVEMLLNHTSGFDDYILTAEGLGALTGQSDTRLSPVELLAIGTSQPLVGAPGELHHYSNTNYVALGLLLEAVTGQGLADLIRDRVTEPLGMDSSYFDTGQTAATDRTLARGYEPDALNLAPLLPEGTPDGIGFSGPESESHVDTSGIDPSWSWAAGAMVSTAADWALFDTALLSGRLLPPAQLEQMQTTVVEDAAVSEGNQYGLGLEKVVTTCGTVWGHTGGIPGYSSEIYADRSGTRTVSVFTSTLFGLQAPGAAEANAELVDAAVCTMLGEHTSETTEG